MKRLKEVDDAIEIDFHIMQDFQVMSKLVRWCDNYTRWGRLHFDIMKDFIHYTILLKTNPQLKGYINSMIVYCRFHKTTEFEEFIKKKFKKDLIEIRKYDLKEKSSHKKTKEKKC